MFYSILLKTEKGLFCKNSDGKIYFPADKGSAPFIPEYDKNEFQAGDVVQCEIIKDMEKYGFVVMKKVQTEYPKTRGTDTIFYNGQNFVSVSMSGNVCAVIDGREWVLQPYNRYPGNAMQLKDCGYTSDVIKVRIAAGKCKDLVWDDPISRKLIVNKMAEMASTDIKAVYIKGPYIIYVEETKYSHRELRGVRVIDEICFLPIGGSTQAENLSTWENITGKIADECMAKHVTCIRLWNSILPREFVFKSYDDYDPDMDPVYPEYTEWKEWANRAKKIITAKNAGTYAPLISEKRIFSFPLSK